MDLRGAVHRLRYLCQGAPPTPASAGKRFLQRLLPTRGASCSGTHAPAADRPLHEPVLLVFRTFNAGLVITPVVVVTWHALLCLVPCDAAEMPLRCHHDHQLAQEPGGPHHTQIRTQQLQAAPVSSRAAVHMQPNTHQQQCSSSSSSDGSSSSSIVANHNPGRSTPQQAAGVPCCSTQG